MTERMPLQPDPDPDGETLVQREGVNAGSASSIAEPTAGSSGGVQPPPDAGDGTPPHGDILPPGSGETQDSSDRAQDQQVEDGVLAGAPETTPPAPGQYGAESGQDSGSMG